MIGDFYKDLQNGILIKPTYNGENRFKIIVKKGNPGSLPRISGTEEDFNQRIITPDKEQIER